MISPTSIDVDSGTQFPAACDGDGGVVPSGDEVNKDGGVIPTTPYLATRHRPPAQQKNEPQLSWLGRGIRSVIRY